MGFEISAKIRGQESGVKNQNGGVAGVKTYDAQMSYGVTLQF